MTEQQSSIKAGDHVRYEDRMGRWHPGTVEEVNPIIAGERYEGAVVIPGDPCKPHALVPFDQINSDHD